MDTQTLVSHMKAVCEAYNKANGLRDEPRDTYYRRIAHNSFESNCQDILNRGGVLSPWQQQQRKLGGTT